MKYYIIILTTITFCLISPIFGQEEITIRSKASVEYVVDKINVTVRIISTADELTKANKLNHKKSLKVLKLLESFGYTRDEIITNSSSAGGG